MKKIFFLALILVVMTGSAFAGELGISGQSGGQSLTGYTTADNSGTPTPISRMSNNVYITAQYSDTGYALATYHSQGTKAYGTGYDSTSLFWAGVGENCIANSCFTVPSSSVSDEAFAGWTAM